MFVQHASPSTITTFQDQISNELPQLLGHWSFELQIYLNNKYSKPEQISTTQVPNRYLYSLKLSYLKDKIHSISIINNNKSIVTAIPNSDNVTNRLEKDLIDMERQNDSTEHIVKAQTEDDDFVQGALRKKQEDTIEEAQRNKLLLQHIKMGCCSNLSAYSAETFEALVSSRLQSLWALKQTIKGEGGFGYIINVPLKQSGDDDEETDKFRLRTSNCFLHGIFKGFLIEIEHIDEKEDEKERIEDLHHKLTDLEKKNRLIMRFTKSIGKIKELIEVYHFPEGNLCFNVLNETKLDYLSDLCQQYCDALQF